MLGEIAAQSGPRDWPRTVARWHTRLQFACAASALAGIGVLSAIVLSKSFFLGSDSAHHYAHVWYISDQVFHHARLPLHVHGLESGRALTFPYAALPWLVTAVPFAIIGDRAVTISLVAAFVAYGYAATRARPALRDPRLLSLLYVNTFLIEGFVSFQFAFLWSVVFFFLFVEAVDRQRWVLASLLAALAVSTHPFAGGAAVAGYTLFASARRPRDIAPLAAALGCAAIVLVPYGLYIRTTPSVASTHESDLIGTLKWIARYRGSVVLLPLVVSMFAPAFRAAYLIVFAAMALQFVTRIEHQDVNTFGLDRQSRPFYGAFVASPAFDTSLRYRVLEPNDREDGAYQLLRHGAVLTQEFFDQSQFRRWWNSPEQYACFLGAKDVDVVLLEKDYPLKFSENESVRLHEFEAQGKATVTYRDPRGRFTAYDVRRLRESGARLKDCGV